MTWVPDRVTVRAREVVVAQGAGDERVVVACALVEASPGHTPGDADPRRCTPAVLLLVTGSFAIAHSAWWWIVVALSLALVVLVVSTPARLERRAELLRRNGR